MEAIPIVVFWCLIAWAVFQPPHVMLYLFFASVSFGSLAVVPIAWTGGFTLVPTTIVGMLLIARQLGNVRGLMRTLDLALQPSAALLLLLFWVVAGITTLFMPRFFRGEVLVMSMALSTVMVLEPTSQNLTQFVYMSISVLGTFAFAGLLPDVAMRHRALNGLCLGAGVVIVTGFLDHASQYLPLEPILQPLRTANYALNVSSEILQTRRIVGLMPEASTFGTQVLTFLAMLHFFRRAMPRGPVRHVVVPILIGLLLALAALSTSSTAYVGLCVLAATGVAEWCWRVATSRRNAQLQRGLENEFWLSIVALWLLLLVVITVPRLFAPIEQMFDMMVLQKTRSLSYEERSMWNHVSWNALLSTYGLGVGLGGTRTSNFAVSLVSSVGLLGATFYFLFVVQCLFIRRASRADNQGQMMMSATRWTYLPIFLIGLAIATTPDFGLMNGFLYGLSMALAHRGPRAVAQPIEVVLSAPVALVEPSRIVPGRGIRFD